MMRITAGAMIAGAFLTVASVGVQAQGTGSATIDAIVKRGELNCGTAGNSPMFSLPDSQGVMRGIDVDACRAVAAAILGDAKKVKFIPTTAQNRFTALQSGEVDMLYRSTTWTLGREGNLGGMFASVNFYDGTGFLVKTSLKVAAAKELDGATVCVAPGTSTELAVADFFRIHKMKFTPILIQDTNEIQNAYLSGRCDVYSTDASGLAGFRFQQGTKMTEHLLLPEPGVGKRGGLRRGRLHRAQIQRTRCAEAQLVEGTVDADGHHAYGRRSTSVSTRPSTFSVGGIPSISASVGAMSTENTGFA